ncbi:MAG: putative baseplate assembly protein [Anaerolineales bacterium]|nr:putative baseplate assembly protein [Anaerolineales bacterium]
MALANPPIDIRRFQDIVDEAKKKIPAYFDGWTDHNVSDPGVTFIELFAWMTEMILYQTNQMPDRHYFKLMELFGMRRRGAEAASAPVTFWLSNPLQLPLTIPAGTEVATTQTETEASIVFSTVEALHLTIPTLRYVMVGTKKEEEEQFRLVADLQQQGQPSFEGKEMEALFQSSVPQTSDGFYLGFTSDLSNHLIGFHVECQHARGAGARNQRPPFKWETAVSHDDWRECTLDHDGTNAFNKTGDMSIHVPEMSKRTMNGYEAYWLRVIPRPASDQNASIYTTSPLVKAIAAHCLGGTVLALHGEKRPRELLGYSDGSPGQIFGLQGTPILLPLAANEKLEVVRLHGEKEQWECQDNFNDSQPDSQHFTLDAITGELRLGPAIQQRDAREETQRMHHFGAVPPRDAALYFTSYRTGGGRIGNVRTGMLNTLKTSIPYVAKVSNREPAVGGKDMDTLAEMMMQAPRHLNARQRAVTAEDFEYLAQQAVGSDVARVKCFQPQPFDATTERVSAGVGEVHLLVIPTVPENVVAGRITPNFFEVNTRQINAIRAHLEPYRLLTVRLNIHQPQYHWVSARVTIRPNPSYRPAQVRSRVIETLNRYLNPVIGWRDKTGWPFGRHLYDADVYLALRELPEVLSVREVDLYDVNGQSGLPQHEQPLKRIVVFNNGVIASGIHDVVFDTSS